MVFQAGYHNRWEEVCWLCVGCGISIQTMLECAPFELVNNGYQWNLLFTKPEQHLVGIADILKILNIAESKLVNGGQSAKLVLFIPWWLITWLFVLASHAVMLFRWQVMHHFLLIPMIAGQYLHFFIQKAIFLL